MRDSGTDPERIAPPIADLRREDDPPSDSDGREDERVNIPTRRLHVEDGSLDTANLVYAWVRRGSPPTVAYVGATSLPLAVRTWLHLNDSDPEIGRIRAHHPEAMSGAVDVIGFELDRTVERRAVKAAVAEMISGSPPPSTTSEADLDAAARIVAQLREYIDGLTGQ